MKKILIIITLLFSPFSLFAKQTEHSFAIYIVEKDDPELKNTTLSNNPVITDKDIIEYNWETHSIILTSDVFQIITSLKNGGLWGKPFIVVVDGLKCYKGSFWSSLSSISYSNPIINISPIGQREKNEIIIERAYPTAKFATGDDPRKDMRIYNVLYKLGKIKKLPTKQSTGPNPPPLAAP